MQDEFVLTRPADGLLLISLPAGADRARSTARRRIRVALRVALARELSLPLDAVAVVSSPGAAPRLAWPGGSAACSISHEDGLSLAAICLHGPVGIDLMRVQAIADWKTVARDYLGPEVAAQLEALTGQARAQAFAAAWTAREAVLKCRGTALSEWSAVLKTAAPSMITMALPLPEGWAGTVAASWAEHRELHSAGSAVQPAKQT